MASSPLGAWRGEIFVSGGGGEGAGSPASAVIPVCSQAGRRGPPAPLLPLADSPDHAGPRDLHERLILRVPELGAGVGLAIIPDRAEVHEVEGAIRPKLAIHGAVDAVNPLRERLIGGLGAALAAVGVHHLVCRPAVQSEALRVE